MDKLKNKINGIKKDWQDFGTEGRTLMILIMVSYIITFIALIFIFFIDIETKDKNDNVILNVFVSAIFALVTSSILKYYNEFISGIFDLVAITSSSKQKKIIENNKIILNLFLSLFSLLISLAVATKYLDKIINNLYIIIFFISIFVLIILVISFLMFILNKKIRNYFEGFVKKVIITNIKATNSNNE